MKYRDVLVQAAQTSSYKFRLGALVEFEGRLKDQEVDVASVVDELILEEAKNPGGFRFAACAAAS